MKKIYIILLTLSIIYPNSLVAIDKPLKLITKEGIVENGVLTKKINSDNEDIIDDECAIKYKKYDESHIAYSKKFSEEYGLPSENIEEMPEYLQFIEMVIRSEFGKPVCYLNMAIDNRPDILKIPKKEFHVKRFKSSIAEHLKFNEKRFVKEIISKSMRIEIVNFRKVQHNGIRNNIFLLPYDLFINNDVAVISTVLSQCSLGSLKWHETIKHINTIKTGKNGVLQIQKANSKGTDSDIRLGGKFINSEQFYHTFILPKKWYSKVNKTTSEIEKTSRAKEQCRYKQIKKENKYGTFNRKY